MSEQPTLCEFVRGDYVRVESDTAPQWNGYQGVVVSSMPTEVWVWLERHGSQVKFEPSDLRHAKAGGAS